ncbi:MAG: hypothetical protein ACOX3P_04450 [Saccharofermentanales bacterium]|jgi:methyl-accepting chemotaxis protein|nr:hypothetical protein [Bacillota bacterium]
MPYDISTIINSIFILAMPLFLLAFSLFAIWRTVRVGRRSAEQLMELETIIEHAPYPRITDIDMISARIDYLGQAEVKDQLLSSALTELVRCSHDYHNNCWLYDPASRLNRYDLLTTRENHIVNGLYSKIIMLLGLLSTATAAFSLFLVPKENFSTVVSLLLSSLIAAATLSYLLKLVTQSVCEKIDNKILQMNRALLDNYPVFTEQTGLAKLSGRMFEYEQTIKDNLTEFEQTARKLVEGEFSQGINHSVRQIMSKEISPPIVKAADTLSQLATDLTERQEKGMADLAARFSSAVTGSLEDHLKPLNAHLGKLNDLIAETEAYVGVSVQTLETSREQNIALNQEISEALRLMTLAKNDLANEMLDIRDYLEKIGDSTNKLARLYQGEDRSLSLHISNLANQISVFSERLNASITESASALEQAAEMTKKQEEHSTDLLAHLDRQVQQLSEINRTIQDNTTHFTTESAQFVHQTLSEYDTGLGEVIERLSFVVAEIRDAIDGLPVALRLRGEGTQDR